MKKQNFYFLLLFCPLFPLKSKYTYFSQKRRKKYIRISIFLFIDEIATFVIASLFFADIIKASILKNIAIVFLLFSLIILTFSIPRLEKFVNYLKEQDKEEIRKNINWEIKKIKKFGLNEIDFLKTLKEENNVVKHTLENNKESVLVSNLINTLIGITTGYFLGNTIKYKKTSISILVFLLIVFIGFYLYFILDINGTSKSYLIELYDYQINYSNRLLEKIENKKPRLKITSF